MQIRQKHDAKRKLIIVRFKFKLFNKAPLECLHSFGISLKDCKI